MTNKDANSGAEQVSDRIFTVPNLISFIRLCLVPIFLVLLFNGYDVMATFLYALAAGTDWIDGQIARRTNAVSKLGQLLDPAVDRILMISGVCGLFLVGRLPLWIILVVLVRDLLLLVGGACLLKRFRVRVPVIYPGKVATTLLFVGFAGLLLNWPLIGGLGIVDAAWLPGFNAAACSWGIWFVYAGLVLALATTVYYVVVAVRKVRALKDASSESVG
ncbi:CDP-alcohol phosphatidyltransferase family protein [Eggerthella sinensis]|jgi:cardiolipin synthase (CMP-forming)|uniref:CDP-alcohol phosphatidyltransferase n=1 Tax=Eggerthella sinensis TaxID=242230 RepID=A0A3N0IWZ0_9ACTN|nr:CDP-alcohol phosphatidyltransferase family protein [Eggerthella sinensis]MCB7036995.1 CDP-alcohol phosphatidyltransferase family protein [Eggerthella sinensis]RDB68954.1 CDP-alcohol phosphatidyltransferase [Eggerthella sinensis]RNM41437.1 CDP-alcohol phosphatidyltransferase [Eggerthella sinensis]